MMWQESASFRRDRDEEAKGEQELMASPAIEKADFEDEGENIEPGY
jgi:hypothetical protein